MVEILIGTGDVPGPRPPVFIVPGKLLDDDDSEKSRERYIDRYVGNRCAVPVQSNLVDGHILRRR